MISIAFPSPTRRARRCVPPPPGMMPRLISGCPSLAVSDAMRMSHARATSKPPPRQNPLIIAMINGFCLGGGLEVALACDIRIASETARLGQPEINLGIIPGGGGTQRLARLVGEGKAMEIILTGDAIDAAHAREIGLVNQVVAATDLRSTVLALASRIAEKSPIALRMAKDAVKSAARMGLQEGLQREMDLFCLTFGSEDKAEGVRAFLEKRKADFKGR